MGGEACGAGDGLLRREFLLWPVPGEPDDGCDEGDFNGGGEEVVDPGLADCSGEQHDDFQRSDDDVRPSIPPSAEHEGGGDHERGDHHEDDYAEQEELADLDTGVRDFAFDHLLEDAGDEEPEVIDVDEEEHAGGPESGDLQLDIDLRVFQGRSSSVSAHLSLQKPGACRHRSGRTVGEAPRAIAVSRGAGDEAQAQRALLVESLGLEAGS